MTCSPTAVAKLRCGLSELQAGDGLLDRIYRRPSCATRARLANRVIPSCRCEAQRRTPLHALVRPPGETMSWFAESYPSWVVPNEHPLLSWFGGEGP